MAPEILQTIKSDFIIRTKLKWTTKYTILKIAQKVGSLYSFTRRLKVVEIIRQKLS